MRPWSSEMLLPFTFVLAFCCAVELILQKKWIAVMKRMKIEQVTKLYGPAWHEKTKMGTPTMGGVVFIPALILSLQCSSPEIIQPRMRCVSCFIRCLPPASASQTTGSNTAAIQATA